MPSIDDTQSDTDNNETQDLSADEVSDLVKDNIVPDDSTEVTVTQTPDEDDLVSDVVPDRDISSIPLVSSVAIAPTVTPDGMNDYGVPHTPQVFDNTPILGLD